MYTNVLKAGYVMLMEPYNGKVRIIIKHGNEEYVCRMETPKKLKEFAGLKDGRIFKGRLKLYKKEGFIHVMAKGEVVGTVDEARFIQCLEKSGC